MLDITIFLPGPARRPVSAKSWFKVDLPRHGIHPDSVEHETAGYSANRRGTRHQMGGWRRELHPPRKTPPPLPLRRLQRGNGRDGPVYKGPDKPLSPRAFELLRVANV